MNGQGVVAGIAGRRWGWRPLAAELVPENDTYLRIAAGAARTLELFCWQWSAEAGAKGARLAGATDRRRTSRPEAAAGAPVLCRF